MFSRSEITIEDQARYAGLIKSGNIEQALDEYIDKYVNPFVDEYSDKLAEFMQFVKDQEKSDTAAIIGIAAATIGISTLLKNNFALITTLYTKYLTKDIKSDEVKQRILETALNRFNEQIDGTMSRTSQNVINAIREIQTSFITEEARLRSLGLRGQKVQDGVELFKKQVKIKFPNYEDMIKNKSFLKSTPDAKGITRNYQIEPYIEKFIRTSILDVDRISSEVSATTNGALVVEYYKRDNRSVIKERVICKRILKTNVFGLPLLALSEEVGKLLGIMTVDQAKNTPDYAMGSFCRHSIRPVSKEINNKIRGMLAEQAA